MVFASLLFVFLFFPLCLIFYFFQNSISGKNTVLLIFSLIFYAWSGPAFLLLLIFDTFVSWVCALGISRANSPGLKRLLLVVNLVLLLGILGVFKYGMFFLTGFQTIFGIPEIIPNILLPVGISFYTFQLLSYTVDVYREQAEAQEHFLTLLLFSSLFHQCIAGPIIRYNQISEELTSRQATVSDVSGGIYRFALGLAKKAVLANGCAEIADTLLASETLSQTPAAGLWVGVLCFNLQIYLDFSAYSDMAIGMGLMMGFHFPENFNYPYISKSMKEFWRRWHITLSSFFRDYVYIPLGGNRVSLGRWIFNMLVVWALTGLWHGAHLNYIFWGLYSFVFLVLEKLFLGKYLKRLPGILRHLYAILAIYFSFMIFKFTDLREIGITFKGMFGLNHNSFLDLNTKILLRSNVFFLIFCCIACTPLYKTIHDRIALHYSRKERPAYPVLIWDALFPVVCLLLSLMALVGNSYNPFLYFQF
jgi:alginate O-acetyltransferase complex protein AlgI